MINIGVAGAHGRMGQLIVQAISEEKDLKLVAKLIRENEANLQAMIDNLESPMDVLIDFSPPSAVIQHVKIACQHQWRMVIGSTGFTKEEQDSLKKASTVIPILFSPNMSIVANITYKILALVTDLLYDKSDISILDIHHQKKKDAPSGTALRMAEIIDSSVKKNTTHPFVTPITSMRTGDNVGEHHIWFSLEGERLEINHKTFHRMAYAKGALRAARWIMNCATPGLYDMQDALGL